MQQALYPARPDFHIQSARKPKKAEDYCQKPESRWRGPWQYGDPPIHMQGRRSDLESAIALLDQGHGIEEVAEAAPEVFVKYHGGLSKLAAIKRKNQVPDWRDVKVVILWGEAGTGKTRFAMAQHEPQEVFLKVKSGSMLWWCGYDSQEVLVLDDYCGWIPYRELLKVLDGNKIQLQVKNGHCTPAWTTVYITSNRHPREVLLLPVSL